MSNEVNRMQDTMWSQVTQHHSRVYYVVCSIVVEFCFKISYYNAFNIKWVVTEADFHQGDSVF